MRLLGSLVPLHHGPIVEGVEGLSLPLLQVFLPYHHCSSASTGRKVRLRERFHDFLHQVLEASIGFRVSLTLSPDPLGPPKSEILRLPEAH